jgi:hypothetical protein
MADSTWVFGTSGGNDTCGNSSGSGYTNSYTCGANATPGSTTATVNVTAYSTTDNSPNNNGLGRAQVNQWDGGFGVKNAEDANEASEPNHALDNSGNTDILSLNFGTTSVALTSINLGYIYNNSSGNPNADLSILAWMGAGAPPIGDKTIGTSGTGILAPGSGWVLVGNYANFTNGNNTFNSSGISSSWWLISAYNSNYGTNAQSADSNTTGFTSASDYVKIFAVSGKTTTNVPEPGSLALIGAALMGIVVARKRQAKKAA